ncbi:MAG: Ca-activated chloride channel family protein [Kiritimatiellia bacterium]|jgi:Ca-activated chloride channel family protein
MKTTARYLLLSCLLSCLPAAFGNGVLLPKDPGIPALAIKNQRVDIQIKDGIAATRIEQVFKNSTDRDLEATYIFPLPKGASITEFAMYINGKRESGELVEKDKAKMIYQDIVRRMKDPGLLEHIGGQLFQVSVYPVPKSGEQKIELEYTQTLPYESGLYTFTYPLKTGSKASRTLEDFTVSARIHSSVPLKNVYSPSHEVGISRKNDHDAIIGFEEDQSALDKDFVLYYGVSKKDFGLNLLTHRDKAKDGYYMMMLAPSVNTAENKVIKKDVVFVFDTSGSMAVKKMDQARAALEYCVKKLNKGDRFNIVRFSTDVENFKPELVKVNDETREEGLAFARALEARGGTNIDGALQAAMTMRDADKKRPYIVVFLTDGKPTIGETDTKTIVDHLAGKHSAGARVFAFGVGEKVNTHLLDMISSGYGGLSTYVEEHEDIEVKVSSFSDKISYPVLSNLKLAIKGVETKQQYPKKLTDLFSGDQLTVIGRYTGDKHVAITLSGEINGEPQEYVYEGTFAAANADNTFIPHLWATRRVGYLLDEIRLNGEEQELKSEVIQLSKEFGIMTPYTSYLVLENDDAYHANNIPRGGESKPLGFAARPPVPSLPEPVRPSINRQRSRGESKSSERPISRATKSLSTKGYEIPDFSNDSASVAGDAMLAKESGREALKVSEEITRYKKMERSEPASPETFRIIDGHTFYKRGLVWTDETYDEAKMKDQTMKVAFASDAYFKLLEDHPKLQPFFALGEQVIVVVDGKAYIVEAA